MCSIYVLLFFFFKQKTAYEMRISDWSSDVCSSDLRPGHDVEDQPQHHHDPGGPETPVPAHLLAERAGDQRRDDHADVDRDVEDLERHRAADIVGLVELADLARDIALEQPDPDDQQIGRAHV